jgi:hypothetical protein
VEWPRSRQKNRWPSGLQPELARLTGLLEFIATEAEREENLPAKD